MTYPPPVDPATVPDASAEQPAVPAATEPVPADAPTEQPAKPTRKFPGGAYTGPPYASNPNRA